MHSWSSQLVLTLLDTHGRIHGEAIDCQGREDRFGLLPSFLKHQTILRLKLDFGTRDWRRCVVYKSKNRNTSLYLVTLDHSRRHNQTKTRSYRFKMIKTKNQMFSRAKIRLVNRLYGRTHCTVYQLLFWPNEQSKHVRRNHGLPLPNIRIIKSADREGRKASVLLWLHVSTYRTWSRSVDVPSECPVQCLPFISSIRTKTYRWPHIVLHRENTSNLFQIDLKVASEEQLVDEQYLNA